MISKVLKCFVFIGTLILQTHAFWWRPPTTTESPTVLKQIPLTYFRTYTYQPLTGGPYTFPFFGTGGYGAGGYGAGGYGAPAPQSPILAGARYEHYASSFPLQQAPHTLSDQNNLIRMPTPTTTTSTTTTTAAPPTTTTTTTTTTTPPPPPTTTTTTSTASPSTTTTAASVPAAPNAAIEPLINSGASGSFASQYAASADYLNYNRRVFTNNYSPSQYYRPHYPYPEYSTFNSAGASKLSNSYVGGGSGSRPASPAHVQFVPCMCPVSVGVPSGLPIVGSSAGGPSNSAFLAQSRTTDAEDEGDNSGNSDMDLPFETKSKIIIEPEVETTLVKSEAVVADLTIAESPLTNKLDEVSFEKSAYEKLNEPLAPSSSSGDDV